MSVQETIELIKRHLPVVIVTAITVGGTVGGGGYLWYDRMRITPLKEEIARLEKHIEQLKIQVEEITKANQELKQDKNYLCKEVEKDRSNLITRKIPFTLTPSGCILYVFSDSDPSGPSLAKLPADANTYIIGKDNHIPLEQTVDLGENIQMIEKLELTVSYEYDANTRSDAASLEFRLNNSEGNLIGKRSSPFKPTSTKQVITETSDLNFSKEYQQKQLIIQAKPTNSGDFGFYISSIEGNIVTSQSQPTNCDLILEELRAIRQP